MISTPSAPVVGIAWYRPETYARIVAVMADGASFPKTHASWRQKAGRMERELKRQGSRTARIEIDPDAFAAWCGEHGLAPDSPARVQFVAETAEAGRDSLTA